MMLSSSFVLTEHNLIRYRAIRASEVSVNSTDSSFLACRILLLFEVHWDWKVGSFDES